MGNDTELRNSFLLSSLPDLGTFDKFIIVVIFMLEN